MELSAYSQLAAVERQHWWYTGMASIARDWLHRYVQLPAGARVLDVGCGTGGALGWLTALGTVHGLDRHPRALHYARQATTAPLLQGDAQALPFAADSFSLLTCFDVLYHRAVASDWAALREFARVLEPGGWLLIRVPALDSLSGAHDEHVHTCRRYRRSELLGKLAGVGLRRCRVSYLNSLLLLPAWCWRRFSFAEQDLVMPPRPVNAGLRAMLELERLWLRYAPLPVGMSLLALARKDGP